ncbi:receptor-like protein EIX1 [Aristolochia californica]|uniref:receptor-like protein EIX1 n=1 Tax=Aristolochia californica TaxID=171875 RepID=UPI0035E39310
MAVVYGVLLPLLLASAFFGFAYSVGAFKNRCIDEEKRALIEFKKHLTDPANRLSSWEGDDCCGWPGISCDLETDHVTRLGLQNPGADDYDISVSSYVLGGEISPSLLQLKHLISLDLSYNDFNLTSIPSFFGSFRHLRHLNLTEAGFAGKVPHELGNLSNLQYLILKSNANLEIENLKWLSRLSSLQYLDLSDCSISFPKTVDLPASLLELYLQSSSGRLLSPFTISTNLTSLKVLDISNSGLSSVLPKWLSGLQSLTRLVLSSNEFEGQIPDWFCGLRNLKYLDMSSNNLEGPIPSCFSNLSQLAQFNLYDNNLIGPIWETLSNLTSLEVLNLANNHLSGPIPSNLGHLTSLQVLDLSANFLTGSIPASLGNLCSLQRLKLRGNNLDGVISGSGGCITNSLQKLDLIENQLKGELPSWLMECRNLQELLLFNNSFSGKIPSSLGRLSMLEILGLGNNNLNGSIPESLGLLSQLRSLDVSYNNLVGAINEIHFKQLTNLKEIDMSSNSVFWNVSSDWIPPFQVSKLHLSSCTLGPRFPTWLQNQTQLNVLDISGANISDVVPNSFWNLFTGRLYLNMSDNRIRGKLPNILHFAYIDLSHNYFEGLNFSTTALFLDISSNLISGQIPMDIGSKISDTKILYLSNNRITGSIPSSLCELSYLVELSLSMNQLSGVIPNCWWSNGELKYIDLSSNNLVGEIPTTFGNLSSLVSLHLSQNSLTGGLLPIIKKRLPQLSVLDLGENKLFGALSTQIGEMLPNLKILRLRSNRLYGDVPSQLTSLASLRVLDLAHNNLSGNISESFENLTAMKTMNNASQGLMTSEDIYYQGFEHGYEEIVTVSMKGRMYEYSKTLPYLCNIDLSENNLSGEIPSGLTHLLGLNGLNLSGNNLTGKIPNGIGDLKSLESLDLSRNGLFGEIPSSLSALDSLNHLNLSYNNLSGEIPTGSHLQTLEDISIYIGNRDLCGTPTTKKCRKKESFQKSAPSDSDIKMGTRNDIEKVWFSSSVVLGFIMGFWGIIGSLLLNKSWRTAYYGFFYARINVVVSMLSTWLRKVWR